MLQCTDIRILWDPTVVSTCWSMKTLQSLSYTNLALNIVTDLLFAVVIPTPMLWKLNVNLRTRISLIGVLGLGIFACAAAFVKLGYLASYGKLGDWLWDSRNITVWTAVELNVGIIAGSLPSLRPLFRRFLGNVYGKSSQKAPTSSGAKYGTSSTRSGTNWQSLNSARCGNGEVAEAASSQRAINHSRDDLELRDHVAYGCTTCKTTILTTAGNGSSDEGANGTGSADGRVQHPGIKKTIVTTIEVS